MVSIYLSPSTQEHNIGHGDYGTEEQRMNEVANVVEQELKLFGFVVYRNKPSMTLEQVVEDSNKKKPDIHFAIHSNSSSSSSIRGAEIFCHKFGGRGEQIARVIYKYISKLTPVEDRGIKEGYNFYNGKPMYELAKTNAPAVLLEIDFHDNLGGAKWIMENIEAIGVNIAKGLIEASGRHWQEKDFTKLAIEKFVELGDIKTPEYWFQNARPGKTIDGEYAALLLRRIAERFERREE